MTLRQVSPFTRIASDDLPIYQRTTPDYCIFYTPGFLVLVDPPQAHAFALYLVNPQQSELPEARELRSRAVNLLKTWENRFSRPFSPLCLTLYLHNNCNMSCIYCYSSPTKKSGKKLTLFEVQSAAEVVASNCRDQGQPFTVVFHGGGEPTLYRSQADQILDFAQEFARMHGLELFNYIATNGVMTAEKAAWIARRFNLVGISCDGPESITARQRPPVENHPSIAVSSVAGIIDRTACIVREAGKPLQVRVTVTPANVDRQPEIVDYICRRLKPVEIHLEPVYRGGRMRDEDCFTASLAEEFVNGYLEARRLAAGFSIKLTTSGARPGEIHGPYCHIFRDVLNLLPGGAVTACFKIINTEVEKAQQFIIGESDPMRGNYILDEARIRLLRQKAFTLPSTCQGCFNRYHCAGLCPDVCLLDDQSGYGNEVDISFRCKAQKYLAERLIDEAASMLWRSSRHNGIGSCQVTVA